MRDPKPLPQREQQLALLDTFSDEHNEFVALGKRIGPDALNAVLETLGGQKPHVPTPTSFWSGLVREVRDEKVRARFRGNNIDELAQEFELSERHIRNILATSKQRRAVARSESTRPVQVSVSRYDAVAGLAAEYVVPMRTMIDALLDIALSLDPEISKMKLRERLPQLQLLPAA